MRKSFIFLIILLLFFSCSNNKKYKYVEFVKSQSVFDGSSEIREKDAIEISAPSDSDAYLDAFQKFCISSKLYESLVKQGKGELSSEPIRFALYDENGIDIASIITFATKEEKEADLIKGIMGIDLDDEASSTGSVTSRIDSSKIKELLPYFRVQKDEFDPNGKIAYKPKSAPKYINQNGIYCYFVAVDGNPGPLRFVVQYYADDWLFFKKIQFSIDGDAYEYVPLKTETDHGNGFIWEWCDEALSATDHELIYSLSNATSAKMKFIGSQYYDIKSISKAQILDLKRTLELYQAMGGDF